MANSSWFNPTWPSSQTVKYRIEVTENSQNMSENYTNITVRVRLSNATPTKSGIGDVDCTINGVKYSNTIFPSQTITSDGFIAFENTVNIYHNADGTKSIWISAELNTTNIVSDDQGFTVTLTTIARKSTIASISGDWFNSSMTVTIDQKSSSFTTSVFVKTPNSDWVNVIWKQSGTSFTFTLPMSLVNSIPNATECSGTVKIRTYNGDTEIGDDDWGKWMGVPDWVKPSINNVQLDTDTQVNGQWMFVQWKSKLKVTTSASGSYSSSISTIRVDYDGSQYWGSEIWTNILANNGSRPVTVHVWDSRNRYASWSGSINVEWYGNPWGTLSAYRCDANGNRDDTSGKYVRVIYSGDKAYLNGANTFRIRLDHREAGKEWSSLDADSSSPKGDTSVILGSETASYDLDKFYEIRLRISDWYATTTYTVLISTAFVLMDFKAGGKGLGIGRIATLDNVTQFATGVEIYSGRDNNPNYGADLVFKNCGNKSQDIGVCGAIPNSNELLNIYRFTDSDEGSAGTIWKIDKWNCIYNHAPMTYFQRNIRFYDGESSVRYDGAPSYQFFNATWLGYYDDSAGTIWGFDYSTKVLSLKAGYTTSDERTKYDIDEFTNWDDFYNFYMSLKPKIFKYNNDMKNDTYIGLVAQDVTESIVDNNLMNEKLALVKTLENDAMDDGREYKICYQELISLNIKMIQKHEEEIKELNNTIAKQQEEIDQLKDIVNQLVNKGEK